MSPTKRLLITSLLIFLVLQISMSTDIISANESLEDGELLVFSRETFTLGFFSPGNSSNRFIGIWYTKVSVKTVVWVANRDHPINDTSGVLSIDIMGNLILHDRNQNIPVWATNATVSSINNSIAQLLDSGNLVLVQQDSRTVIWESFDYPTHALLPYMKLGLDRKRGLDRVLRSWKSLDDPGTGDWSLGIDPNGSPQTFLYKGQVRWWRTGPWDGLKWNGIPETPNNFIFNRSFVNNDEETISEWGLIDASIISMFFLDKSGFVKRATWQDQDHGWSEFWTVPKEPCDYYEHCGSYGNCNPYNAGVFECTCLPGFEPKSPNDWYLRDGSGGCVRKHGPLTCGTGEGFVKTANSKLPDTSMALVDMSLGLKACEKGCLKNCSCMAYASADVNRGIGCITWYGDLIDTRVFTNGGQDLYVRVDAIELAQYRKTSKSILAKKGMLAVLVTYIAVTMALVTSFLYWVLKWKANRRRRQFIDITCLEDHQKEEFDETRSPKLPSHDVKIIIAATDNFSSANKLGQGGFGSVYKGQLANGKEIAVKRLSKSSRQGAEEFKNEVRLISKLQHKNLVRLFGCCIHKEEKMLVYEFLPNKSLDFFIFDKTRRSLIDWTNHFEIILGIARGLLYLHQDSRLTIIHRDLKAANVLLDAAMNPKISDFGMARIVGEDQIEANTKRVVGTYGYMSPEYAMDGIYSTKSDVFSFGVLTLEIISGRKNNDYSDESSSPNLIGHAWDLWREGKALEIVDSSLGQTYASHEALRCIQAGLLCVQECPVDRPTMLAIVFMLGNETTLPSPNRPAYILRRRHSDSDLSSARAGPSANDVTITNIEGR